MLTYIKNIILLNYFNKTALNRWGDLIDSTLVKFDKLPDLVSLIKKNIDLGDTDYTIFQYLVSILDKNDSQEMEDLVFEYLDKQECSKTLRRFIDPIYIYKFEFNERLFEFIKEKNLLALKDEEKISILDIETRIFEALYGSIYR